MSLNVSVGYKIKASKRKISWNNRRLLVIQLESEALQGDNKERFDSIIETV